jgi:hypothetical protein
MVFIIIWLIGLLIGLVTTIFDKSLNSVQSIATNFLFYQITFTITVIGLICFIGHVFKSDNIAEKNQWPKGNLFQKELGISQFGWTFAGLLGIRYKGTWLSTIIIFSVMFIGAAIIHIYDTAKNKNHKKGNPLIIIADLIVPISILVLSVISGAWN